MLPIVCCISIVYSTTNSYSVLFSILLFCVEQIQFPLSLVFIRSHEVLRLERRRRSMMVEKIFTYYPKSVSDLILATRFLPLLEAWFDLILASQNLHEILAPSLAFLLQFSWLGFFIMGWSLNIRSSGIPASLAACSTFLFQSLLKFWKFSAEILSWSATSFNPSSLILPLYIMDTSFFVPKAILHRHQLFWQFTYSHFLFSEGIPCSI